MSIAISILESRNLDTDIVEVLGKLKRSDNPAAEPMALAVHVMYSNLQYIEAKRNEKIQRMATLAQDALEKLPDNPRSGAYGFLSSGEGIDIDQAQIDALTVNFENLTDVVSVILQSDQAQVLI